MLRAVQSEILSQVAEQAACVGLVGRFHGRQRRAQQLPAVVQVIYLLFAAEDGQHACRIVPSSKVVAEHEAGAAAVQHPNQVP